MKKLLAFLALALGINAQTINNTITAASSLSTDTTIYVYGTGNQLFFNAVVYVDSEAMAVNAVTVSPGSNPNGSTNFPNVLALAVTRHVLGTTAASHSAGAAIFYGQPGQFVTADQTGGCQNGQPQLLNPATQHWFSCINSTWVTFSTAITSGGGAGVSAFNSRTGSVSLQGSDVTAALVTPLPVVNGGTGTTTPGIVAGTNVTVTGTWPNQTVNSTGGGSPGGTNTQIQINNSGAFGGITLVPIANGGTGTASPALVSGTDVTVSGTWPNQTITNSAAVRSLTNGNCVATSATGGVGKVGVSQSVRAVTGTTDTVLASDCFITYNNAASVAVTLPTAGGTFPAGMTFTASNYGTGTVTVTPATGTIGGGANVTIATSQSCVIVSDGTNWQKACGGSGASGNATSIQSQPVSSTPATAGQALVFNAGTSSYVPTLLNTLGNGICTIATGVGTLQTNLAETIRAVTTTSDIIQATDCMVTYSNAAAIAVSVPTAGSGGNFYAGQKFTLANYGAGLVTVTPSTGTIAGQSNLLLKTGQSCQVFSDGTNYQTACGAAGSTFTNCSSSASPAVCGSAAAGSVAVPAGTNPTLVVDTTAVTANSQIFIQEDEGLGTKLGVTCQTAVVPSNQFISARTAGTSFTISITGSPATQPVCYSYFIVN